MTMTSCPSCGEPVDAKWDECPACEALLRAPRCPSCGQETKVNWRKCPNCKAVLSGGATSGGALTGPLSAGVVRGGVSSPFLTAVGDGGAISGEPRVGTPRSSASGGASPVGGTAAPVLTAGSTLGKYSIERVLGTGAYGTVYAAHNMDLDEVVALKALGTFGDPEGLRAAVAAEFKTQRGLSDKKHILESYPPVVEEDFGLRWVLLPMELAQGTFRDWLNEKRAKPEHLEEGLALLRQAVAGLLVLHDAGIVHRDVKPENLLLVPNAKAKESGGFVVKVGDFGLASGLEKLASERPELLGDGIGTPAYMAPEQVMAAHWKDVTAAADAYAIGTILFEMLDGERPYSGTAEQLRAKKRDPLLIPRLPDGPEHLSAVALALLAQDKRSRLSLQTVTAELVVVTPDERTAWVTATTADTEESYGAYVSSYPRGVWAKEASTRQSALRATREQAERDETGRRQAAEAEATHTEEEQQHAAQARAAQEKKKREQADGETAAREKKQAAAREAVLEELRTAFVRIPAGLFTMGDKTSRPPHLVRISRGFQMQKTPVTQAQWGSVMGDNPSRFTGDSTRPVEQVSWDHAQWFIAKLNGLVRGGGFRLPTEAEWEYACRAGTTGDYGGTGRLEDMGWYDDTSGGATHPVMQKHPNAWGLYDMHGNVFEWCQDWYDREYYTRSPETDPVGPNNGWERVSRGGSWSYYASRARSAFRNYGRPSDVYDDHGFRLARST